MSKEELLTEEFLKQFKNGDELNTFLNALRKRGVEQLLEGELDAHLGYEKHDRSDSGNVRNGHINKKIKTVDGELSINVPRDRDSSFSPALVPKRKTIVEGIENVIMTDAGKLSDQYAYDANANVTAITDLQEGLTSRSMSYDGLNRLKTANGSTWGTGSYTYDVQDNLRSSTVGGRSLVHTIDGNNRLSSLTGSQNIAMAYDANGNITQRGAQSFNFDIGNRMQSAPAMVNAYIYDGHGRRSQSAMADGSWRLHAYGSQGKLLFSYRTDQGHTRYVHLGDKLISETTEPATTYSHTDALGSPVAKTNSIGTLLSRTRYEPYGATTSGTNPTSIGFTGHVNDGETGQVYMQQRYYEPLAGRFLSVDPVTTSHSDGSMFNRYEYAESNPYKYIDPDGRKADCTGTRIANGCPSGGGVASSHSGSSTHYGNDTGNRTASAGVPAVTR